jgi:predicted DCC family thiol-disulfide oxidoreductase YuxK
MAATGVADGHNLNPLMTQDAAKTRPRLRILFDGECGLCSRSVRFLFAREETAMFVFTPIQSVAGRILAKSADLNPDDPSSFAVFDENGGARLKAAAALYALGYCRQPWRSLAAFGRLLPQRLCDALYDFVAQHRIRFFGTADVCVRASDELNVRFETSAESLG